MRKPGRYFRKRLAVASVLSAVFLFAQSMGSGAHAQDYEQAIKSAAESVSQSLKRKHGEAKVAIVDFRDGRVNVECEPLSSVLTDMMRKAIINYRNDWDLDFEVVEEADPSMPDIVVVVGSWLVTANEQVELTIKVGDLGQDNARHLQMETPTFDKSSLSSEAASCVLEFEMVDRRFTLEREALVRQAPSATAPVIEELQSGTQVWVVARVKGGDWRVVLLPEGEDGSLLGTAERRGFIFGLAESGSTDAPTTEISTPSSSQAELAFWESIKDSENAADFEAYLEAFPDGVFARLAQNRLIKFAALEEAKRLVAEQAQPNAAEVEIWRWQPRKRPRFWLPNLAKRSRTARPVPRWRW